MIVLFISCKRSVDELDSTTIYIEMETELGHIVIQLFDETPLHRDNFKQLVQDGYYDSLQFHRIIEHFVIQTGDPESKSFPFPSDIGSGGLDYTIPAEFHPTIFHKRGTVGMARDDNPNRASSSTQFYIVQGRVHTDSTLTIAEDRINGWLARYYVRTAPENQSLLETIEYYIASGDTLNLNKANSQLNELIASFTDFPRYTIPDEHRKIYKTIGGIPHLDQSYTVFGKVVKGMEIVDRIASLETGANDRPVQPIRILYMKIAV